MPRRFYAVTLYTKLAAMLPEHDRQDLLNFSRELVAIDAAERRL